MIDSLIALLRRSSRRFDEYSISHRPICLLRQLRLIIITAYYPNLIADLSLSILMTINYHYKNVQPPAKVTLSEDQPCHINQVLAMKDGKPERFINAYPCVDSPYGMSCKIERVIVNENSHDAVLRLRSTDGSIVYAFDQLYTANRYMYEQTTFYFINFSAWAHEISISEQNEVIKVEDTEAIRYHRAFNDIVAANDGKMPDDLQQQIKDWQPETKEQMAPVEINLGHMCAYLFGDTLGQEDEAWCQGQVLGKQQTVFNGKPIILFDVVILREQDADPFVIRIAACLTEETQAIEVNDYVQANIWLQAAIYKENQQVNA